MHSPHSRENPPRQHLHYRTGLDLAPELTNSWLWCKAPRLCEWTYRPIFVSYVEHVLLLLRLDLSSLERDLSSRGLLLLRLDPSSLERDLSSWGLLLLRLDPSSLERDLSSWGFHATRSAQRVEPRPLPYGAPSHDVHAHRRPSHLPHSCIINSPCMMRKRFWTKGEGWWRQWRRRMGMSGREGEAEWARCVRKP
jgi:hypothetical protein